MKLSKYTIIIPAYPFDDYNLLFSTLTRDVTIISQKLMDVINNNLKNISNMNDLEGTSIDDKHRGVLKKLQKMGIIVQGETNENQLIKYIYNKLKFSTSTIGVVILPHISAICHVCIVIRMELIKICS